MASKGASKQRGTDAMKEGIARYLELIRQGPEAAWRKEELLTCVHWQKQVTALVIGLVCGILPLTGVQGFATFAALQIVSTMFFYRNILRVDEEVHGGVGEALLEGLPTFTAIFVLFWVVSYNLFHV